MVLNILQTKFALAWFTPHALSTKFNEEGPIQLQFIAFELKNLTKNETSNAYIYFILYIYVSMQICEKFWNNMIFVTDGLEQIGFLSNWPVLRLLGIWAA